MDRDTAENRLYELWGEITDLEAAEQLLEWDQETHMPAGAQAGRGKTLATLAGLKHRLLSAPELREALAACEEAAEPGSALAAQVRWARRDVDRAVKVPETLERELAEAKSRALAVWIEARRDSDFERFVPEIERLVELRRQEAAAIDPGAPAYDVLLDLFEPGSSEAGLVPLFEELRRELGPLVRAVAESGVEIDESPALGHFPEPAQKCLGLEIAAEIGFDFESGRLDLAPHPFCVGIAQGDVRLTWRYQDDDFRPALFGILHEMGHGLYEQGLPGEWRRTPAGRAMSLGIHESQSRMWENLVGRSRGFWQWALPRFQAAFPGEAERTVEALWPALHTVKPSPIRVEADEATYNLHVLVRFELERALFAGQLQPAELGAAWDDLYQEVLGIRPGDAAEGVLQDVHWAHGVFGYFPTYTLGNLMSAQLYAAAERDLGDLDAAFARGEFAPLLGWLREKIHHPAGFQEPDELIERASGKSLDTADLLAHLRRTAEAVYPLVV